MENHEGQVNGGSQKSSKNGIIIVLILLLLIGAGVGGFFFWKSQQATDTLTKYFFDKYAEDGILEGKTPDEIESILNSIVEEGMFNVAIGTEVRFNDSKSEGTLGFENIAANHYYARVELRRNDDGTVIYKSEGIKPGQYIKDIKLSKNLPKGQYDCTAVVIATDPDSLMDIGQVEVLVKVVIIN